MLLFISEKVINTSWLILSVPKGKSNIILVLQQGIMKTNKKKKPTPPKKKRNGILTCQRLHPKSTAEPVRASEDYIVIVSEL